MPRPRRTLVPETFEGMEAAAVREIRELILDLKDEMLMKLLRSGNLTFIDILRARDVLDQFHSDDLAAEMEEIFSKYARWSFEDGLRKIDGMLGEEDLSTVLNLPPANIEIAKTFNADKIKTIAPQLLEEVNAQLSLAFVGERTPQEISNRIANRFDVALFKAERIVRTENKGLQNQAEEARIQQAFSAGRELGIPMIKTWIHSSGAQSGYRRGKRRAKYTPRPHHKAMHGVTVKEGEPFTLVAPSGTFLIDGPHAESLPAEEVINCYCDRGVKIDREAYRLRPQTDEKGFPLDPESLKVVKNLGGTTGAMLVEDPRTGQKFVRKKGNSPEHIREEATADAIYQAAGVNVPDFKVYETPQGPVKLAKYIEDAVPLSTFLKQNSMRTKAAKSVVAQLQDGFATDALLGNWDVAGLDMDNILVDKSGTAWRIDNGGSLRFRAQGAPKTAGQWNGTVGELESLRSKSMNAQTAKIFGTLSDDDVKAQVRKLGEKREAILAAAKDAELQEMLGKRLDFLENWATPKAASSWIDDDFAKAVQKSRIVGKALKIDREDIEDTQALFWAEKVGTGEVVRMKTRLTLDGSRKLMEHLRTSGKFEFSTAAPTASTAPADPFWDTALPAIKTINVHTSDDQYNKAKIDAALALKPQLAKIKAQASAAGAKNDDALYQQYGGPKNALALVDKYEKVLSDLEESVAKKKTTQHWDSYDRFDEPRPTSAAPKAPANTVKVKLATHTYTKAVADKGFASRLGTNIFQDAKSYQFELDGVEFRFIPYADGSVDFRDAPYALHGYLEAGVKGSVTTESLGKIAGGVERLGVNTKPVTDTYKELVYLRKGMQIRTDVFTDADLNTVDQMIRGQQTPDEQIVQTMRTLVQDRLNVKLPAKKTKAYDWEAEPNSFGEGWEKTYRWDLPREKVEKGMADYALYHGTSNSIPDLIDSLLNGGGDFTPTTERLRKGIPISAGMSPQTDLQHGTANYLFTRIRKKSEVQRYPGLTFKIGNLARQDAFSFGGDWMGGAYKFTNKQVYQKRGKTVTDFKRMARSSGNETLFKNGINVLDEIETITVPHNQRQVVIDVFKRHGYTTLPDGRKIEDVVIASHY